MCEHVTCVWYPMVCVCCYLRHGLPRVASGYWKPSHEFVLSPKSSVDVAGGNGGNVGGGGNGATGAQLSPTPTMSPAHKWNLEAERLNKGRHMSVVSDSMGRDVVYPSVALTQFHYSGRFGVREVRRVCVCLCACSLIRLFTCACVG